MIPLNEAVAKEHCEIFNFYFGFFFFKFHFYFQNVNWSSNMQSSSRYLA
jgi:hypothetical protein